MQRRDFLTSSLAAGAALATLNLTTKASAAAEAKASSTKATAAKPAAPAAEPAPAPVVDAFVQPPLPYSLAALAPFLKEEQMSFHYSKHHAGYFKKLNGLVSGKPEAKMSLEELITKAQGPIFNNAAQAWNHTFFWSCISPDGGGSPKGPIGDAIDRDFGGIDQFKKIFTETAVTLFGSGWAWLAAGKDKKLQVLGLPNADNPLRQGLTPILTLDVWEHAYYIDYRNDRAKFVEEFWTKVNWEFAAHNLATLAKA